MKLIDDAVDNPRRFLKKLERVVPYLELLSYFWAAFVVMLLWGILAQHFGVPTLSYWYSLALVYLVKVFHPPRAGASTRFKHYLNIHFEYEDNVDDLQDMVETAKRLEKLR